VNVVYTAILGTSDSLKIAPKGADRCVCFVDNPDDYSNHNGWELIPHEYDGDPRREAWRLRCRPDWPFASSYDRIVWIDASFTLTNLPLLLKDSEGAKVAALRHHARRSPIDEAAKLVEVGSARAEDAKRQVADYAKANYRPTHLSISCIVVRDRSEQARRFNETWEQQISEYPGDNTQVSLDFSAWANGFEIKSLRGTRHDNPYATHDHLDHKKRRKPYQLPSMAAVNA
jgi:hypothetical protein